MRITLDTDTSDCPGAVCKVIAEDGRSLLVQQDWDAPGIARTFGWDVCACPEPYQNGCQTCYHEGTDGTVDCPTCGTKASVFIGYAQQFIDENDGREADDPGYFDG